MTTHVGIVDAFSLFYDMALYGYTTMYPFYSFVLTNYAALNVLNDKCKKNRWPYKQLHQFTLPAAVKKIFYITAKLFI